MTATVFSIPLTLPATMAQVTVPIQPLLDWWQAHNPPHQHLGCRCGHGGSCASWESLSRQVGVSHSTIFRRIRQRRLDIDTADTWAIAVGVHPRGIWPDWHHLRTCYDHDCDREEHR